MGKVFQFKQICPVFGMRTKEKKKLIDKRKVTVNTSIVNQGKRDQDYYLCVCTQTQISSKVNVGICIL